MTSGGFQVSDSTIETAAAALFERLHNVAPEFVTWAESEVSEEERDAYRSEAGAVLSAVLPSLVAEIREQIANEMDTRIEYGQYAAGIGWLGEHRGIKYATHQRTVHFRVDAPVAIDHWTYTDHRHPVEGCTHDRHDLTTDAVLDAARVARGDAG